MIKKPLFLKFANREISVYEMLQSFSRFSDKQTADAAMKIMQKPPDLSSFQEEFIENVSRYARVKNDKAPWIQGLICYNLCLYIKAYGLENVKSCKICGTFFNHKGKYAVYCSDSCKIQGKRRI